MHIIEWILKRTNPNETKHVKKTGEPLKRDDPKGDNADLRHKVCPKCRRAWEINKKCQDTKNKKTGKQYHYNQIHIHYYEDMVTYGKVKEICPQCKEKINENNINTG